MAQLKSLIVNGASRFIGDVQVSSTTKCTNLNADMLDGYHVSVLTASAYSSATKNSSTIYFVTG